MRATEQVGRFEGVPALRPARRRRRAPGRSRPWCRPSCACARRGTRSPAPRAAPRSHAGAFEDVGDLAHLLGVDPAHDVGHGAPVECGGDEEGGQELGRRRVPELTVRRRAVGLRRLAQVGGDPDALRASRRSRSAATRCWRAPRGAGRVDAPDAPALVALAPERVHAGGRSSRWPPPPDRPTPGSPERPGSGLPALRRAHDDDGLGSLGRQQGRMHAAGHVPKARRPGWSASCVDQQRPEVAPAGPAGAAVVLFPTPPRNVPAP